MQLWLFTLSIKLSGQCRGFLLLNKYTPVILITFFSSSSTNVLLLCFRKPIKIKNRNTQLRSSFFQESFSNPSLPRQVLGFSQGFIFSRLPSLQHIFLPHLFAPSPLSSVQFSSVAQLCLTLSDPMNRSTPGLPVHHQLLESTQTHAH